MSKKTANLLCLLVAIIWGGGFIAVSAALNTFGPYMTLAIRFSGAAVLALLLCLIQKTKLTKAAILKGSVCGLFMYLGFAFQTCGLALTDAGSNAFFTAVNVVAVPYFAWIAFKKRPSKIQIAASFLCFIGIACLSLSAGVKGMRFGDLLSLICAFMFAAQIVSLEWACKDEDPAAINTMQMISSAVIAIPVAFALEKWPANISSSAWLSCFYLIFVSTFLAFLLQTTAQKYTDASSAALLLCTESLWANIFSYFLLHEEKTPLMLLGGLLIFISILIVEGKDFFKKKQEKIYET